jgi:hypothetical protein
MLLWVCLLLAAGACERGGGQRAGTPFDGEVARQYVKAQLDFGPRVPGTDAHRKAGDWIVTQMKQRADTVFEQTFSHTTVTGKVLPMRNIFARFRPSATERVLYLTHWDSRPTSDESVDPAKRALPVPGANDGASGVALFIALGDVLKKTPPTVGVDLLFTDGEDWGDFDKNEDVLIGSTYFAEHLPSPDYQPMFGVLWDMIGDRDLQIYQEINSIEHAPEVVTRVWSTAAELGYQNVFIPQQKYQVTDDHMPLVRKGLRVIDVIDLDYQPYHHTPEDTFDKVTAQSLKIVGDVAVALVSNR